MRKPPASLYKHKVSLFPSLFSPDVDECSDQTDEDLLCDHFCHNYIGGYYCSCRYGYLLHSDNRTCRGEAEDRTNILMIYVFLESERQWS